MRKQGKNKLWTTKDNC